MTNKPDQTLPEKPERPEVDNTLPKPEKPAWGKPDQELPEVPKPGRPEKPEPKPVKPLYTPEEKLALSVKIRETLERYGNAESNIPVNDGYWDDCNRYRGMK